MTLVDRLFTFLFGPNGNDQHVYLDPAIRRRVERDLELKRAEWAFHAVEGRFPSARELWAVSPPDVGDYTPEVA